MGLFERFFGRRERGDITKPVANEGLEQPPSLAVVFDRKRPFTAEGLEHSLRQFHPTMSQATVEIDPETAAQGTPLGLIAFGNHVVKVVGFDIPMPSNIVEMCVAPSHYSPDRKTQVRAHQSHILLYYAGNGTTPIEQYLALAAVVGSMTPFGAIGALNEAARTSLPAGIMGEKTDSDRFDLLRELLLLHLIIGFVKYEIPDVKGIWMRTYGAEMLGLPNFAMLRSGHYRGKETHQMFENIYRYLLDSGASMEAGHTMQIGEDRYLKLRAVSDDEYEQRLNDAPGELLIAKIIRADQINQMRP